MSARAFRFQAPLRWRWIVVSCLVGSGACSERSSGREEVAARNEVEYVGYDLRRIRPHTIELSPLFDRLWRDARAENKRVAVLFTADWCDACRRLELEFGNMHPRGTVEDVRILQFVEEDWEAVTRIDEVHELRRRWYKRLDNYPVMILLDQDGKKLEEMEEAIDRLEGEDKPPSMVNWFLSKAG